MDKYLEKYPPMLKITDVAEILCLTPRTVRRLVNDGVISGIKIGRLIRVSKETLINYMERGNQNE